MRTRSPRAYTFPIVLLVVVVLDWYYIGTAQFVNALTIGGVYALIALGYTMVYGIIELINFAHGDVFMVGSMVTMFLLTQLGLSGAVNNPIELAVLLVVTFLWAMTIMGIIGVIIERFAYRPLRNAPKRSVKSLSSGTVIFWTSSMPAPTSASTAYVTIGRS